MSAFVRTTISSLEHERGHPNLFRVLYSLLDTSVHSRLDRSVALSEYKQIRFSEVDEKESHYSVSYTHLRAHET